MNLPADPIVIFDARTALIHQDGDTLEQLRQAGALMQPLMRLKPRPPQAELLERWSEHGRRIGLADHSSGAAADGSYTWFLWCVLVWADRSGWFDPTKEPEQPPAFVDMLASAAILADVKTQAEADALVADIRRRAL